MGHIRKWVTDFGKCTQSTMRDTETKCTLNKVPNPNGFSKCVYQNAELVNNNNKCLQRNGEMQRNDEIWVSL